MQTITAIRIPVEAAQVDALRTMFAEPAFGTLREIIAAHCALAQVDFMNTSLYVNDNADERGLQARVKAIQYNATLDVLDEIQAKGEEWFRIKLEAG